VVRAWCMAAAAAMGEVETPTSIKQALGGPQSKEWRGAIDEEWAAMKALRVWDPQPVPLPPGKTAVDGKFVFAPSWMHRGRWPGTGLALWPGGSHNAQALTTLRPSAVW